MKTHCFICGTDNCCQGSTPDMVYVCIGCDLLVQREKWGAGYNTVQGVISINGNGFVYESMWKEPLNRVKARFQQAPQQLSEKPCKQCSRVNDVGVSKCWYCECLAPCA